MTPGYYRNRWNSRYAIHLFTSVGVTSRSLKLFDLFFIELMYDRRVLSVFFFPINHSAVLLKNSLSF